MNTQTLIAAFLMAAAGSGAVEEPIYDDPLTRSDPFTHQRSAAQVVGGRFVAEGWQSVTSSDQLYLNNDNPAGFKGLTGAVYRNVRITRVPPPSGPRLLMTRDGGDYVITSTAPPTWKVVLAGTKKATAEHPGAGTIRALYLPATATESVVESVPGKFCCAGWGLDHLEWRYVNPGPPSKGVRSPSGTRSETDKIELVRHTPDEITLRWSGHWQNVPRYSRTITFNPRGLAVRIEADWEGREGAHSMWWLMSLFRASWIDGTAVTIRDADTPVVPLPIARGKVFPLPEGIGFPYEVIFPLKRGPLRQLVLRVAQHGEDAPAGLRYELWPEIDGYHMFYPRWVIKGFTRKTYVFDYSWRFDDASQSAQTSNLNQGPS